MTKSLFIVAHPDDETIFFGNSVTKLSDDGYSVYVLSLTDGENGFVHHEAEDGRVSRVDRNSAPSLGEARGSEFIAACRILGVTESFSLGLPDGGVGAEHSDQVAAFIRQFEPDIIYTFDPTGTSVHPDHQACFYLSLYAVITIERPINLYHVQKPAEMVQSMDEWSYTNTAGHAPAGISGFNERILQAAGQYLDQAKLINYFQRIGFLAAPESHAEVRPQWDDFGSQTVFSEPRVEKLYRDELEQYRLLIEPESSR